MIAKLKNGFAISPKNAALALSATNGVISANTFIYVMALFLSSYPISWIPYYFVGRTCFEVLISSLAAPLLTKYVMRPAIMLQIFSAIVILGLALLLTKQWYLLPLIFSLVFSIASLLSGMITGNNIRNAFDVIDYKQISPALAIVSVTGKIVISLGNALLIKRYGIAFLPYLTCILLLSCSWYLWNLKPLPIIKHTTKHGSTPTKYPLFVKLFLFSVILAFVYTLADYVLRTKLSIAYNSSQIGQFISIFSAAAYFVSIVLTYFFARLLTRWGVARLLQILPAFWIILPIAVMFFPNMVMVTLMGSGDYVLFNFVNLGRSYLINVLPIEIRTIAASSVTIMAESLGIGIASILLIIVADYITIPRVACIMLVGSLFLILYTRKLQANYIATLKDELFLKRFNVDEKELGPYQSMIEENILLSFNSPDPAAILFGYSLLSMIEMATFPTAIMQHLNVKESEIRIQAIKAITTFKQRAAIPALLELLNNEQNPEVIGWIINALARFSPDNYLVQAQNWIKDPRPEICAGGILILFLSSNQKDIDQASVKLSELLQKSDVKTRRIAVRVLNQIPLKKISNDIPKYIADTDDIVSSYVIDAIYQQHHFEFAGDVIARLLNGGVFYSASKMTNQMDEKAIPLLINTILKQQNEISTKTDILVTALAQIKNEKVENELVSLAKQPSVLLKQVVASEAYNRARHMRVSDFMIDHALMFAFEEAELIHALMIAIRQNPNRYIANEMIARIQLARERYLNWLGIYVESPEVFGLIPVILHDVQSEQAKAIELLCNLITNHQLVETTLATLTNKNSKHLYHLSKPINDYFDPWIKKIINTPITQEANANMNNMQKVFTLRQVELFKNLPAETLLIIANEVELVSMTANQILFLENDPPTGLYIIVSGIVNVIRHDKLLATLKENEFFGELALIDNAPRAATVVAQSEGTLLLLNRDTFERITNDLPEVLRSVTQVILRYLRTTLAQQK